jgi:hypothetical protein
MLGNQEDAEEALQDAFTAYRSLRAAGMTIQRLAVPHPRQPLPHERGTACAEGRRSCVDGAQWL